MQFDVVNPFAWFLFFIKYKVKADLQSVPIINSPDSVV